MLSTTKLPRGRLAWAGSRWLTQLDNATWGLIKLSGLTLSMEGRDLMGPRSLATAVPPAVHLVAKVAEEVS